PSSRSQCGSPSRASLRCCSRTPPTPRRALSPQDSRSNMPTASDMIRACSLDELKSKSCVVVRGTDHPIAVFWHDGRVRAVDNRCPHMGFPLIQCSVHDGILTCHWHHARFDLASGCTFDLFADDVPAAKTEIRNGDVYVAS